MTHDSAIGETKKKNAPISSVGNVFTQSQGRRSMISAKQDRTRKPALRRAHPIMTVEVITYNGIK
jgi:hypothetical protein